MYEVPLSMSLLDFGVGMLANIVHDLQFLNAGRGYKRRPYGRGIL